MNKAIKSMMFSAITLLICVSLVVGGTYALFTDQVKVNNHLTAGNLKIGLDRISYTANDLDATTGLMKPVTDTTEVDLLTDATELFTVDKAVPTSWYEATIRVSNDGSTAFDYGMRLIWADGYVATAKDTLFADQIVITITSSNIADADKTGTDKDGVNYVSAKLSEIIGKDIELGYILKNDPAETFTVKAEFVNNTTENNKVNVGANEAKPTLKFDVQVYATQKVSN